MTDAAARLRKALAEPFPREEIDLDDVRAVLAQSAPAAIDVRDAARTLVKMHEARADFYDLVKMLGFEPARCRKEDGTVDWALLQDGLRTRDAALQFPPKTGKEGES